MGAKWNDFRNDVRETIKNTVVLRFSRMITQVSPQPYHTHLFTLSFICEFCLLFIRMFINLYTQKFFLFCFLYSSNSITDTQFTNFAFYNYFIRSQYNSTN